MTAKLVLVDNKKQCTKCKEWKSLEEFVKAVNTTTGKAGACKSCVNSERKERYDNDEEFRNKFLAQNKKSKLKLKYGLSVEEYEELLKLQDNSCKICSKEFDNSHRNTAARVDHCHTTGKVRGLLCTVCNVGLGNFYDNKEFLMNAILYLKDSESW